MFFKHNGIKQKLKKEEKNSGKFTEKLKFNTIILNNQWIKKNRKYFEVIENKYETY